MRKRLKILGHRGSVAGGTAADENTLAAFARAIELGADGVELDVRVGRDGSLLLHHDPDVDGWPVADMSLDDRPESMPILADSLDALAGSLVNIEIKNLPPEPDFDPTCAIADAVVEILAERRGVDNVIISSFHPGTVDRVKALAPDIPTGVITWFAPSTEEGVAIATSSGHDAIHPHVGYVTEELVVAAHVAGLAVNAWTVNEPDVIARMIEIGVDAIVTDDIATAVRVVEEMG